MKYRIGAIGWYNFETLVQTLLKGVIGPGVTSFGGTKDGGRDATFRGTANFPSEQTKWDGYWVFQVKYHEFEELGTRTARTQLKNTFKTECKLILAKAKQKRVELPDNYVLITNLPVTSDNRKELKNVIRESGFQGNYCVIDGKEVCQFLDLYPQVRRSYPQLIGLGDLDRIFNHDLYVRSEAYVQQWQLRLATFVITTPYNEALKRLKNNHFIVLDGPPEAGKSTTAAALALTRVIDGFEVVDIRVPEQIFKVYNPSSKQLFVADDAVGSVSFDPSLTDNWSRDLPGVLRKLDGKHLLIWTTRSYILEEAISESRIGEAIRDFPGIHEVLVEMGSLSLFQKAEILYNHAKQAHLSEASKELIRENAINIADHPNFTPERIRQLVENILPSDTDSNQSNVGAVSWEEVQQFMKNPGDRWIQAYQKLSESERILLSAMLDFNTIESSRDLERAYELRCRRLNHNQLSFDDCVNRLEHSFIHTSIPFSGQEYIDFQHPSLRDMLLSQLREDDQARCRHIQLASSIGLANLIKGIALSSSEEENDDHILLPKKDEELSILIKRIEQLSLSTLDEDDCFAIISATDLLIPRDSSKTKISPAEIDLFSFKNSQRGRLIEAVLNVFGSQETFRKNQRYSFLKWTMLLEKYYNISLYLVPYPRPDYIYNLVKNLTDEYPEYCIKFVNLIQQFEPTLINQTVSIEKLTFWDNHIKEQLQELKLRAEDFPIKEEDYYDDYCSKDDYNDWYGNADDIIELARGFYKWTSFETPDEIDELESLMDSVIAPFEGDYEYDDDIPSDSSGGVYWTIEKMFEDL